MQMVVLPYLSAIHFSGTDAGDFLHNQLSADVLALASGESTLACYCEPKGRVLALMLVGRNGDDYYVILSSTLTAAVAKRLGMYVLRADVNIKPMDGYSVAGLGSADKDRTLPEHTGVFTVQDSDNSLMITRNSDSIETDPALQDAWKIAELKRGISWLCSETSGQFLPQMLGFDSIGAVNFKKGCYPGQEIVARIHYLGKLKRHPRLLCTTAMICPDPLDKVEIFSGGESYDAVIADCGHRKEGGSCLFVVTRMDPDLVLEKIEYKGGIAPMA